MDFKFKKRAGRFGTIHNRSEYNGEDREKAFDVPVTHTVTAKELDMLIPTQGILASEFLFGEGPKPQIQTHVLFPIKIQRKPENLTLTIYDSEKLKPLVFENVNAKDPTLEYDVDSNTLMLSYKIQLHPGKFRERLFDHTEDQVVQFEVQSAQTDVFDGGDTGPAPEGAPPKAAAPTGRKAKKAKQVEKPAPKAKKAKKAKRGQVAAANDDTEEHGDNPPLDEEGDGFND